LIRRPKIRAGGILVALLALLFFAPAAHGRTLEEITLGPNGTGNATQWTDFNGASEDLTRVFFSTPEALTPDDADGNPDVYERSNGVTTKLSEGPNGGNGNNDVVFRAVSDDGKRVFFQTGESLVTADADGKCYSEAELYLACSDVYERTGSTTNLVSTGPSPGAGGGNFTARFRGMSKDGTHVFFSTAEQLVPADTDTAVDIYERFNGTTTLVSTGPAGGNSSFDAYFRGCSDDGSHVFMETLDQLTSNDTDSEADVYDRSGGTTTLVSTGPAGGNGPNGSAFKGASADGSRVFFETDERLTSTDTDSNTDVYQRLSGTTTLISTGPSGGNGAADAVFAGASKDGAHAWFETNESLVAGDTDGKQDVYERFGGSTSLVSTGPWGGSGSFDASFESGSADGSRVWIGTFEQLAPTDTDSYFDIYERAGGTTTQVSLGPAGGNGSADALYAGSTPDGSRVFFETLESLVPEDTDAFNDVYMRFQGATTLISSAPNTTATSYANFLAVNDNGSRILFKTGDKLVSQDTDTQTDIYASLDTGFYARPKGATPFLVPLVIAYRDCTSANRMHGAPLANPSCSPPVPASDWLTVGTPDANMLPVKSVGSVSLRSIVGDPSTPANEADVRMALSVTDVRRKSDLADYAGELQVNLSLRVTDRLNGTAPVDPGTIQDFPFGYVSTCATTTDTTVGSTCSVDTTANAIIPGVITEGKRTVWQVGTVDVSDGGSDGDVGTGPNTLFERQGIFVP
jgi:hypothetical protein